MKLCQLQLVAAVTALLLTSCTQKHESDYSNYRRLASYNLRNPKSAEFRNERIRTIWSKNGDRKKVYCAEFNFDNAFGGKTGFQFLHMDVLKHPSDNFGLNHPYINNQITHEYYWDCIRPDTERRNGDVFAITSTIGEWTKSDQAEADHMIPFVSNSSAPEQ